MARWGWQADNRRFSAYFLVSLALIVASFLSWRPASVVEQALTRTVSPFLVTSTMGLSGFSGFIDAINQHFGTVSENKRLKAENENFHRLWHNYLQLQAENQQLKQQTNFQKPFPGKPLTARVITDSSSPFAKSVLIKTKDDGIEKGQAVLNEKGLVGRVIETFGHKARLLLLTDYNARVPVRILENNEAGILRGTNSHLLDMMVLANENANIEKGMHVVTSGTGGVFSANIPVGMVEKASNKHIKIKPYVNFNQLDIVTIKRRKIEGVVP